MEKQTRKALAVKEPREGRGEGGDGRIAKPRSASFAVLWRIGLDLSLQIHLVAPLVQMPHAVKGVLYPAFSDIVLISWDLTVFKRSISLKVEFKRPAPK